MIKTKCEICKKGIAEHKVKILSCHKIKYGGEEAQVCEGCYNNLNDMYWEAVTEGYDMEREMTEEMEYEE